MDRNGYSWEEAVGRLASQMPLDEKIPFADIVIENKDSMETTRSIVNDVWEELIQREKKNRLNS
jgi:dephospho-CoA kinase